MLQPETGYVGALAKLLGEVRGAEDSLGELARTLFGRWLGQVVGL